MIHPMWNEYAKVALRVQLDSRDTEAEEVDDLGFRRFAALAASEAADIADAMCAEYDKRNNATAGDVLAVSAETAERLNALRSKT